MCPTPTRPASSSRATPSRRPRPTAKWPRLTPNGTLQTTNTNAYSGNNGRAAIYDAANNQYLTVGNAGNGNGSPGITAATGVQIVTPGQDPTAAGTTRSASTASPRTATRPTRRPRTTTSGARPSSTTRCMSPKAAAATASIPSIRSAQAGHACRRLWHAANDPDQHPAGLPDDAGEQQDRQCLSPVRPVLRQLPPPCMWPTRATRACPTRRPATSTRAWRSGASSTIAGRWTTRSQNGLNLGVKYGIAGLPTSMDPATDGLRNLTGQVNGDGTVSLYGVTSTVSGSGDQGARPEQAGGDQ